jgi:hypothetical protein
MPSDAEITAAACAIEKYEIETGAIAAGHKLHGVYRDLATEALKAAETARGEDTANEHR